MSIFRSTGASFLSSEVTKDGIIKTRQVSSTSAGSIPDVGINDPKFVFSKDITQKEYKGIVYALPTPDDNFVAVSYSSLVSNKYSVEKRKTVK